MARNPLGLGEEGVSISPGCPLPSPGGRIPGEGRNSRCLPDIGGLGLGDLQFTAGLFLMTE